MKQWREVIIIVVIVLAVLIGGALWLHSLSRHP